MLLRMPLPRSDMQVEGPSEFVVLAEDAAVEVQGSGFGVDG